MTARKGPWRQGRKVPRNVYDEHGDGVAMFRDVATARRVVLAVNRDAPIRQAVATAEMAAWYQGAAWSLRAAALSLRDGGFPDDDGTYDPRYTAWLEERAAQFDGGAS